MYELFTRIGAGAVISAGLSVLGITYLCTDTSSHHAHHPTAVVAAVQADAALGTSVAPSSHGTGTGNQGNGNSGAGNTGSSTSSGSNNNPGSNPGSSNPGCGCNAGNPPIVNVKPDVDADVNVVVKLPDADVNAPGLVGGVAGTVNGVVDGVLPDCGCTPGGPLVDLRLPVLGH